MDNCFYLVTLYAWAGQGQLFLNENKGREVANDVPVSFGFSLGTPE